MFPLYKITKTFSSLEQFAYDCDDYRFLDLQSGFYVTTQHINMKFDYGLYNTDIIEIHIENNNTGLLTVKKYEYDCRVISTSFTVKRNPASEYTFKINGKYNNGIYFSIDVLCMTDYPIVYLIYALIFISYFDTPTKGVSYWNYFNSIDNFENLEIDILFSKVVKMKNIADQIIQEHPYMGQFLQKGISSAISYLKSELTKLEYLQ